MSGNTVSGHAETCERIERLETMFAAFLHNAQNGIVNADVVASVKAAMAERDQIEWDKTTEEMRTYLILHRFRQNFTDKSQLSANNNRDGLITTNVTSDGTFAAAGGVPNKPVRDAIMRRIAKGHTVFGVNLSMIQKQQAGDANPMFNPAGIQAQSTGIVRTPNGAVTDTTALGTYKDPNTGQETKAIIGVVIDPNTCVRMYNWTKIFDKWTIVEYIDHGIFDKDDPEILMVSDLQGLSRASGNIESGFFK